MPSATDYNSCLSDPNFAVICSFLQHYADILNIKNPTFKELQDMIKNKNDGKCFVDEWRVGDRLVRIEAFI